MIKFNFTEILSSWIKSFNPTDSEKELAEERVKICMVCEFRKEIIHNKEWSALCGRCGCPISTKIFTNQYGTCPLGKWNFIEEKYKKHLKVKEKSLI